MNGIRQRTARRFSTLPGSYFASTSRCFAGGTMKHGRRSLRCLGSTGVLPGEVRTYVMEQSVPSVVYDGDIAVGATLPNTVEIHTVPNVDGYGYTVINERRVIVEPRTHRIIQVLE